MKKSLLLSLLLISCAPISNSVTSPIEDKKGLADGKIHLVFTTSLSGRNGKMTGTTTDGEIFEGHVVGDKSEYSSSYLDDDFGTRFSSKAIAILNSNKGHSMKCTFTMAEPSSGITAGGVGECKISDGRVVPVSFGRRS